MLFFFFGVFLWPVPDFFAPLCVCSLPVFHKTVPKKWDTAQKRFKKPKKLNAEASSQQHSAESQSPTSKVYCSFCTHSNPVSPSCVDVSCGSRSSCDASHHRRHTQSWASWHSETGGCGCWRHSLCRPRAHAAPSSCCTNTPTRGLQEEAIRND